MAISKVDFGGRTLIDLTNDSVTPENLMVGATAHGANGELVQGAAVSGQSVMVNNLITGRSVPLTSITISDVDLEDGVSELEEGQIYIYVEP